MTIDSELLVDIQRQTELDNLDDSDCLSFDELQKDDNNSTPDKQSTTEQSDPESDLSLLQLLDKQKKYLELLQTIKNLPSSTKEIERFSLNAQEAIDEAKNCNKTAQQNEEKGNSGLALEGYEKIAGLVTDFPNISAKINRVKKNLDKSSEILPKIPSRSGSKTNSIGKLGILNASQGLKNQVTTTLSSSSVNVPTRPLHKRTGLILFILTVLFLNAGGVGIFFYVETQKEKLALAVHSFEQCLAQFKIDNFTSAKNSCDIALQLSRKVEYLQPQGITGLTSKIQEILRSEKLQQGLVGKFLIDGQYLTKEEMEILFQFKRLRSQGTYFFEQSEWNTAIERLQQSIDIAHNNSFINTTFLPDLIFQLQQAELQTLLLSANEYLNKKSWKEAIQKSTDALAFLNELPLEIQLQYRAELQQNIARSQFENMKSDADELLAESDWQNAVLSYQRLLALGTNSGIASQETLTEVSANIVRAKLYHTINSGNLAYSSGSWDEAIQKYKNGQSLLADNKDLLSLTDPDATFKRLEKIILQTIVIKNRQAAKKFIEEKNLPQAKISHEEMIRSIKISSFADNSDFLRFIAASTETIQSLEKEIFLNERRQYLEANYQTLFTTKYPAVSPENLSDFLIALVEESSEKFLFKLQCSETNRGRRVILIIHYAYDKKSGIWGFYYENR